MFPVEDEELDMRVAFVFIWIRKKSLKTLQKASVKLPKEKKLKPSKKSSPDWGRL